MPSPSARRRAAGFSLVNLMVVLACVAAILATQIPTQAAARRTAQRMQNSTQLRGIHQGLVTFANSNKNIYAGMNSKGELLADGDRTTGSSGRGDYVQARYWLMLNGDFFTPEYAISPSEVARVTPYDEGAADVAAPVQWNRAVKHYSYAMLDIHADPNNAAQVAEDAKGRGAEWQATLNSQAIVLSDRNTGTDADRKVQSIHTDDAGDWRGSVLWNDNHVAFEDTPYFETKYGPGALIEAQHGGGDNLFADNNDPNDRAGHDALMVTADHNIVHSGLVGE